MNRWNQPELGDSDSHVSDSCEVHYCSIWKIHSRVICHNSLIGRAPAIAMHRKRASTEITDRHARQRDFFTGEKLPSKNFSAERKLSSSKLIFGLAIFYAPQFRKPSSWSVMAEWLSVKEKWRVYRRSVEFTKIHRHRMQVVCPFSIQKVKLWQKACR